MPEGYLCLVLHAHLPFVRHPEREVFLEENWLFEAITETYLPLLQVIERWANDGIRAPLTFTLTPTLCALLRDGLLQARYLRYLERLIELAEREVHRTTWEPPFQELALHYQKKLETTCEYFRGCHGDLVQVFRRFQDAGLIEIMGSAATHAVLPLLLSHPASVRAQVLIARDEYRACFRREPRGIWLPECAYDPQLEPALNEAGWRWFITDSHGLIDARPRPRFGTFAPVITPSGLAVFGRDMPSARQVWSRDEGYPGDPRYRDFYRDIGFDLELDYLRPFLASGEQRSFTGLKYYAISGKGAAHKEVYSRPAALQAADNHAAHFLAARVEQIRRAREVMGRSPVLLAPYDAELFGHWWYEGPEFLDLFVRKGFYDQHAFGFSTPSEYLQNCPRQQAAEPAPSSWGEAGYWRMWLDEPNHWVYPHLRIAQERMSELAERFAHAPVIPIQERALCQAGRELLLAQASDWTFILRTRTSPAYARQRLEKHLAWFNKLYEELTTGVIDLPALSQMEATDTLFSELHWRYWGKA